MQGTTTYKKKKRVKLSYETLNTEEIILEEKEIRERIYEIMKNHVGKENQISAYELFAKIFKIEPQLVDAYKRYFWWDVVQKVIKQMRKDCSPLIISHQGRNFHVLKETDELSKYKKTLDMRISQMNGAKSRAEKWIKEKKWQEYLNE